MKVVLIIAVPGMPHGCYYRAEVRGLTNTTDSTKKGVIYFSATRCMKGIPNHEATVDEDGREVNGWNAYFIKDLIPDISYFADAHDR